MSDIEVIDTKLHDEKVIALCKDSEIVRYWFKKRLPKAMREDFDILTTYRAMIQSAFTKGIDIGRKAKQDEILEVLGLRS